MKQISFLFITLFVSIAQLNAQTLAGEWNVEILSPREWVGEYVGILEDEDFESGVQFASDGKFYCQKIEKGTYRQIGDTLILTRIQEDVRKQEEIIRQREEELKRAIEDYNINNDDIKERLRIYTTDTLLLEKNKSGNTLLLLRISSKTEVKPPFEIAFYLHRKGTNESINNGKNINGEWFCPVTKHTFIFMKNGKYQFTGSNGLSPQNGAYKLNGEYLIINDSKLRFLFGDKFAVWQMDSNINAVIKLLHQTKE